MKKVQSSNHMVIKVGVVAAFAGLLFGLDIAYVNGSLKFIVQEFNLSVEDSGKVAGYLLAGAAFGALFSGWISRKYGRKFVLVFAAALFTFATIFTVLVHSFSLFLMARFIMGLAVGIASFVAPLYLSEIAPFKIRGSLIAMYQLMITIGIFLMFVSNAILESTGSWRIMLIVLLIPSVVMLLSTLKLPESPRWFVLNGDLAKARNVLEYIRSNKDEIDFELNEIKETLQNENSLSAILTKGYFIKILILGVLLQCLQQFSGMNAFMYYSGKIFESAGFTNSSTVTVIIGLTNVLTTLIAIKFVDKIGRKPILYFGLLILLIACAIIGYLFMMQSNGVQLTAIEQYILLICSLLFIFGFAVSLGPIIWMLCAEIFPLEGRDFGITVTTMANWIFNTLIGGYTLILFKKLGIGQTFWLFDLVYILGFVLIYFFTPETKNVPLEEIELNLKSGLPLAQIGKRNHHN